MNKNIRENKEPVFAPKGGKPGYIVNGKWYPVDKTDLNTPQLQKELQRYAELRGIEQLKKDQASLGVAGGAKPTPTPQPAPAISTKSDDGTGYTISPQGSPERNKLEAEIEAANKARKDAEAAEASASTDRESPRPVKSARQLELDKINADKTLTPEKKWEIANPGLAAARRERKAIRGKSETDNPLMQGLRSRLPAPTTALDTTAFKADLAKSGIKPSAYSSLLNNPRRMKFPSVEKTLEAYEVVLDYLLSEGHADTVEEAHYVMMQLDSEYVQSIVEGVGTYKDPVLGPHTPGGKAVRKIGRMSKAAVKGFQGSQAQGLNRLGDAIDAAQKEYQK